MRMHAAWLATAALLALAACSREPEPVSVENNVERIAAELEAKADNLEAIANSAVDAQAAAMLDGLSANLQDTADNVRDLAEEQRPR